jgi:hypothetical protein
MYRRTTNIVRATSAAFSSSFFSFQFSKFITRCTVHINMLFDLLSFQKYLKDVICCSLVYDVATYTTAIYCTHKRSWGRIHRCKVRDLRFVISVITTFSSWFSPRLDQIIIMNQSAVLLVQPPEIQPIGGSRYLHKQENNRWLSEYCFYFNEKNFEKLLHVSLWWLKIHFIISVDKISHICRLNFVQDKSVTSIWAWKYKLIHFASC